MGTCTYKIERLPQKYSILKYNADEDIKALDFYTKEVMEEIDKTSVSIKEWFLCRQTLVGDKLMSATISVVLMTVLCIGDNHHDRIACNQHRN